MDVIADLVLRPTLDEADLTREKQVVKPRRSPRPPTRPTTMSST
jgi:predicted Zn-dependent peptidase